MRTFVKSNWKFTRLYYIRIFLTCNTFSQSLLQQMYHNIGYLNGIFFFLQNCKPKYNICCCWRIVTTQKKDCWQKSYHTFWYYISMCCENYIFFVMTPVVDVDMALWSQSVLNYSYFYLKISIASLSTR